jgi:hypothetical protein|tara:strand:- start:374 stop:541 length:168 start_codon:yes stop_codon:yes gene_type:complete
MVTIPEGYHELVERPTHHHDADHGDCYAHTFSNGLVMYTYDSDPTLIEFRQEDEQ